MEECFRQGDAEKRIGIPVSTFCDRDATVPDKVGRLRMKDPDVSYLYFEIWGSAKLTLTLPRRQKFEVSWFTLN